MSMKKRTGLLVCLMLAVFLLASTPFAAFAEKAGDEVKLSVAVNPSVAFDGYDVTYTFTSGLEYVSITDSAGSGKTAPDPTVSGKKYGIIGSGLAPTTVTLTVRVKEGATGEQTVSFTKVLYYTATEDLKLAGNSKTITIEAPVVEEVWDEGVVTTEATCTTEGVKTFTSDKGNTRTEAIPALGHDWGDWVNKTPASCLDAGTEERVCKRDDTHTETREIAALGHDWGEWVIKVPATCVAAGVREQVCENDNTHVNTEEIPIDPKAHKWGVWNETKVATCTEAGTDKRVCDLNAAHFEERAIPALGHDWGEWDTVTPANCTIKGLEQRICMNDDKHVESRELPLLPHKEGAWEIVKQPDAKNKENGLKVLRCAVGGEILKEEVIPYVTTTWFYNNTASTQGLRFRDVNPELTGKWYMFTPVDLSVDGVQEIPIIASNMYYIGNLTLTVAEGNVTAEYKMARGVNVRSEFLSYFADLSLVEKVEPAQIAYEKLPFGEPVSIETELKGDTNVLLYTHFVVDYNDDLNIQRFFTSSKEYKALVSALKEMMD